MHAGRMLNFKNAHCKKDLGDAFRQKADIFRPRFGTDLRIRYRSGRWG